MAPYTSQAERTGAAVAAGCVVAALALLLVLGLRGGAGVRAAAALVAVVLDGPAEVHPSRPKVRHKPRQDAAARQASPPNLKAQATPVAARPVPIILPPPPVIAAPVAGIAAAPVNGAALTPGPGQGAGGQGNGLGGGGNGGDGAGDGEPSIVGPRRIAGSLSIKDLPEGTIPPGIEASVTLLFRVGADGRVSDCRVDRSSGYGALDKLACALIEQRFRYRPALGRSGRPVASRVIETHSWYVERDPVQK